MKNKDMDNLLKSFTKRRHEYIKGVDTFSKELSDITKPYLDKPISSVLFMNIQASKDRIKAKIRLIESKLSVVGELIDEYKNNSK